MRKYQKTSAPPRSPLRFSSNKLGFIQHQRQKSGAGFTLIELLVVITVLGVLATIVLLAVNPGEQLARARDTSRISTISQLGRSLERYYTSVLSYPPINSNNWMQTLVDSSDLKTKIGNPGYGGTAPAETCAVNNTQTVGVTNGTTTPTNMGYCYRRNGSPFDRSITYVQLESNLYNNRCSGYRAWAVWSSSLVRAGLWCSSSGVTEPNQANVTSLIDF